MFSFFPGFLFQLLLFIAATHLSKVAYGFQHNIDSMRETQKLQFRSHWNGFKLVFQIVAKQIENQLPFFEFVELESWPLVMTLQ
jgi:hypothetical protein